MKLIKIRNAWYTAVAGEFRCSTELVANVDAWDPVLELSNSDWELLEAEFGPAKDPELRMSAGVRPIKLENPAGADKFVTYHTTVAVKKP
jgi:hypothetical protein